MKRLLTIVATATVAWSGISCAARTRPQPGRELSDAETVTERAPDTLPTGLFENRDPATLASRDVVLVRFEEGTSLSAKREAIARVNGRVVGGTRISSQGMYAVRIAQNAATMEFARKACDTLEDVEVVLFCILYQMIPTDTAYAQKQIPAVGLSTRLRTS